MRAIQKDITKLAMNMPVIMTKVITPVMMTVSKKLGTLPMTKDILRRNPILNKQYIALLMKVFPKVIILGGKTQQSIMV